MPGQDAPALEVLAAELLGAAWIAYVRAGDDQNAERLRCALLLLEGDEPEPRAAEADGWEPPRTPDFGAPASN